MKSKIIIYPLKNTYNEALFADLRCVENVFFCQSCKSLLERLNNFHISFKANKYFRLPFQSIWYKSYFSQPDDGISFYIFLFYQGNPLGYDINYINYLRIKYRNSKFCFLWANISAAVKEKYLDFVREQYDEIYTFDRCDQKRFNWNFHDAFYSDVSKWQLPDAEESDVFFVGRGKDRLQLIHAIYDKFTEQGYKCIFYVINVPQQEQTREGIVYNKYIDYKEVLANCSKTKVILELVQEGQVGTTLRTSESIVFKKILLTNNKGIVDSNLYSSNIVLFDNIDNVDIKTVFKHKINEDVLMDKKNYLSPIRFLNRLKEFSK